MTQTCSTLNEIWRDVAGYEGFYQVSNLGRVKSLLRIEYNGRNGTRRRNEKILNLTLTPDGYLRVALCKNGKAKHVSIHRVVALAFLGESTCPQINHIDGNKLNNSPDNLEWCDFPHNMSHAVRMGLRPKGEKVWKAKLTTENVKEIRSIIAKTPDFSRKELAEKYGVNDCTIIDIIKNRSWRSV